MQVRKKLAAMGSGSSDDPKRAKLTEILEEHFQSAATRGVADSRAMVFTSLKDGVADICSCLNALQSGTISAKCVLATEVLGACAAAEVTFTLVSFWQSFLVARSAPVLPC
jgi:hypothetical protein